MKRECISGTISRRTFIERGFAVLGVGTPGLCALAEMARHPLVGAKLPKWEKGHFRINVLFTGKSETSFLVFPDSTSMLIDCGDYEYRGPKAVKQLPDASRRAGEWTARYVLDQNPNGKMVDYFMLSHYHSDHAGALPFSVGRSANGKFSLSGIGQAMEFLDFGKFIDRSWPDVNDPAPRPDNFDDWTIKHIKEVYAEAERRGIKVEKFRLEKGSDQIRLLHGGCAGFGVTPLCANGLLLRRDGTVFDLGTLDGGKRPRSKFDENAFSIGLIFSLGAFRYFTAGDFSIGVKGMDGAPLDVEAALARECLQVDVAKVNHHGHHSMPVSLVKALRARVVLAGIWDHGHMNRPTMRRFAVADWPCLYAPGLFPEKRLKEDFAEPWRKDLAPESFEGAHAVIDVAPDGESYRLMMVSAADESRRIIGAYDFKTARHDKKERVNA